MDDTPDASEDPQPAAPEAGTGTNRRVVAIVAGLVAVLVVVGVAVAATRDSDGGGSSATPGATGIEQRGGTSTTLTPKQAAAVAKAKRDEARRVAAERKRAEQERRTNASSTTTPRGTVKPGSTSPTTVRQVPPPITPPTTPPTILQAYIAGYTEKCADIWKIANADGTLWDFAASQGPEDPGTPYVIDDCTSQMDETQVFYYYDTPEDARAGGAEDAVWNLGFQMTGVTLRNTDGSATWNY